MTLPVPYDPDRVFLEIESAAEIMTDTQAVADQLSELKKSRLAALTLDQMKTCKSRAEAEVRALANPDYEEYVVGMIEAGRIANRAKARYFNLMGLRDDRRTQEVSHRTLTR